MKIDKTTVGFGLFLIATFFLGYCVAASKYSISKPYSLYLSSISFEDHVRCMMDSNCMDINLTDDLCVREILTLTPKGEWK